MKLNQIFAVFGVVALACTAVSGQDPAKDEHDAMRKEHQASMKDHMEWTNKLYQMRIEHRKALAALAKIRAEILEHEVEIEAAFQKIKAHDFEMQMHDDAMHEHEDHGEGQQHDALNKKHAQIKKRHMELKKQINVSVKHHEDLISGILKFTEKHLKKFHGSDDSDH
jgi:SMC interacting uncharacterized protein involved in chromosome segregation